MKTFYAVLLLVFLTACSAKQIQLTTQLSPADNSSLYLLKQNVTIQAPNANASVLKAGTQWQEVGAIEQGTVYKSKDQVVIVNSYNVHEAYIVVNDANAVGYYLLVEKTYVKTNPVSINLEKME